MHEDSAVYAYFLDASKARYSLKDYSTESSLTSFYLLNPEQQNVISKPIKLLVQAIILLHYTFSFHVQVCIK